MMRHGLQGFTCPSDKIGRCRNQILRSGTRARFRRDLRASYGPQPVSSGQQPERDDGNGGPLSDSRPSRVGEHGEEREDDDGRESKRQGRAEIRPPWRVRSETPGIDKDGNEERDGRDRTYSKM